MTQSEEPQPEVSATARDLNERWSEMCLEVEAVHREMAEFVDPPFSGLFLLEADKFKGLGAPASEAELVLRRNQRAALSGKIAALAEAGALAKLNGHVAPVIARLAEDFCLQPLPNDQQGIAGLQRRLLEFAARLTVVLRSGRANLP